MKPSSVGLSSKIRWNSGLPMPSLMLAARMIVPPGLTIGMAATMPFDGLVERRVQRIAGRAGDDDSTGSGIVAVTGSRAKATPSEEGRFHVAGHDAKDPPLGVDHHVDDEIAAGHAGDRRVFLVNRIALQAAAAGVGVFEKSGPCQTRTSPAGQAGANQLPAARKTGHEMRLDQAGRDLQIGVD